MSTCDGESQIDVFYFANIDVGCGGERLITKSILDMLSSLLAYNFSIKSRV